VWEANLEPSLADHNLPPIELPRLQSLNLSQVDLLPFVHTPHLQSLYLYVVHSVSMETFSKRCSSFELSKLQTLKFDGVDLSSFKSQTAVVHGLPLLTELVFWNCPNEHDFLRLLDKDLLASDQNKEENEGRQESTDSAMVMPAWLSSLPKGEIMPRLHSLTVSDELCWPWLREILLNRISRGIPIRRVRFPETVESIERIEDWVAARNDVDWELYDFMKECLVDPDDYEWIFEQEFYGGYGEV